MKRIILHWTAGAYKPNEIDKQHYHYLIDDTGKVYNGNHKPEDNLNCSDGNYAAHTGGGNTGAIGVAVCGMYNYSPSKGIKSTSYPLTKTQCERMFKLTAELCKKYNLPINSDTVMTHYEFGKKHPDTTSSGKIDITVLPEYTVSSDNIGDFIRNKAKWYYDKL